MYLKRAGYTHELNDAKVRRTKVAVRADNQALIGTQELWFITGRLVGSNASDLSTKMAALEAAYASSTGDIVLLQNDGITETCFKITGSQTVGGILAKRLHNPMDDPGNFTTYLDYEIDLEANFGGVGVIGGGGAGQAVIMSWTESVSFRGTGGPRYVIHEIRNGPPQKQLVSQLTPIYATQRGTAVGLYQYPTPGLPIWPQHENVAERDIVYDSANAVGGQGVGQQKRELRVSWSYSFLASQPISGKPSTGF